VGLESRAKAKLGGRRVLQDGTLFLEGQELFFRPDVPEGQRVKRLRIPVAETTRLEATGPELIVEHRGETMRFAIDHPERWVAKIRTPKSRVDKLGIRAGTVVYIENVDDPALDDELSAMLAVKKKAPSAEVDVILLGAEREEDLTGLEALLNATKETVQIWVLWTKAAAREAAAKAAKDADDAKAASAKKTAKKSAKKKAAKKTAKKAITKPEPVPVPVASLREDDIRRAAHAQGLIDVKVASFSDELSALKLVMRKKDRRLTLLSHLQPRGASSAPKSPLARAKR
jgi:hypothetical protein